MFRWFVGLGIDDPVWDASSFCKNRDRLLKGDVAAKLLSDVVEHKKVRRLLSRDHFSVDGTLIVVWGFMKSFRSKDGGDDNSGPGGRNPARNFHGEKPATTRMKARQIPRPGFIARAMVRRASCALWAMP